MNLKKAKVIRNYLKSIFPAMIRKHGAFMETMYVPSKQNKHARNTPIELNPYCYRAVYKRLKKIS